MGGFLYSGEGQRKLREECGGSAVDVVDVYNDNDIQMANNHRGGPGIDIKIIS